MTKQGLREIICTKCDGTGKIYNFDLDGILDDSKDPSTVQRSIDSCPECGGKGYTIYAVFYEERNGYAADHL